ncbi:VOC family protein [Cupriavidus taiwanensis]|uniref:Putative antibiotic resistance protein GlyoxalaseI/dioxygenase domain n=1 Tax=Cupriavidus taiwanensis TaxID=164546 RepID=A0A375IIC2_9BURK|nr:VOC family protein [Cupriavidus taiwanensis]SOY51319.1 putative antibiotic resistance protein; GlyoxalaseI/dioxygenase domain [Cupriavidus taiwanensis]SOY54027.1 putative antibiotic resistance protein; GlyoxalaseI/dioxygenase domain [Cupriavidus taiwanensis]SOY84084.1 putative antibiotic resistance protein; GlyoxalaseI/dioxygenase domain [Cupriavidus taiwanensis]SOZ24032.1 putative antibiotic resistance protein; GlyoxalaseI/dioxygenase domain [Cupriavidus taiwanensis]SOZ58672.1 putative ant
MKVTSYYPVVMTDDVAGTAAFYQQHFGFTALFASDWYVHLQLADDPSVNLALLDGSHETIPAPARGQRAQGLLLNFEVEDPDAVHERLRAAGLPILQALRDEAFGQRHFITADPNGVLIDIIKPIPPSAEFAAQYQAGARPG